MIGYFAIKAFFGADRRAYEGTARIIPKTNGSRNEDEVSHISQVIAVINVDLNRTFTKHSAHRIARDESFEGYCNEGIDISLATKSNIGLMCKPKFKTSSDWLTFTTRIIISILHNYD